MALPTKSSKVNDMGRFVLFKQLTRLCRISVHISSQFAATAWWSAPIHLRSPSDDLAKIQVSPGLFPKRDPSGSVSITCLMACPTRPLPPVTSTTVLDMVTVKIGQGPGQLVK